MAQAASVDTRSPVIAQLLAAGGAPISEASADRRFLRELKHELTQAWQLARQRYYAAQAYRTYCGHVCRIAQIERRQINVPEHANETRAMLDMIVAVDRMMDIPAPTIGALRQKEKLRGLDGGRDRWERAIAADTSRLQDKA